MKTIKNILFLNPPDPALLKQDSKKINCPYFEPPLGLLYVYSYAKKTRKILQCVSAI